MPKKMLSYVEACHAMQTGVAHKMRLDPSETSPKHLRVGVNVAMSDHGALVELLIAKGVFTLEEITAVMTAKMNAEVDSYEQYLSEQLNGAQITLR